jgi:hypothetical protein
VQRILAGTFCTTTVVETVAEASQHLATVTPFLIVVDHNLLLGEAGRVLEVARDGIPCLVLMQDPEPEDLIGLLGGGSLSYLLANPMPLLAEEMSTTAIKLMRGDIFGLEKYLTWGVEVRARELTDAGERPAVVDELSAIVQRAGLGPRVSAAAGLIADELMSNALYNAPVDAAGRRLHSDEQRHGARTLSPRERITLRYACDARYLAIEVSDQFGSLDRSTILGCLAKGAGRSRDKVSMRTRGAGIGLASAYGTSNHLVFNLRPGDRTEVIALIDIRFRPAELANAVCSFGVFAV